MQKLNKDNVMQYLHDSKNRMEKCKKVYPLSKGPGRTIEKINFLMANIKNPEMIKNRFKSDTNDLFVKQVYLVVCLNKEIEL